jgi:hypothetical protein
VLFKTYFGPFLLIFDCFSALRATSDLFWAFSIDFRGKKCQISPKLAPNFPKRASRFNKGSKSIEKKQKDKKEPQKVSKKVQKLQKWF